MTTANAEHIIVLADDDADDRLLVRDALADSGLAGSLRAVEDGEALMAYLRHDEPYAAPGKAPRPDLILLDLNMPKRDGRDVLREIKQDPALGDIPVVVLTTSQAVEDRERCYDLGASSFVVKPVTYNDWIKLMQDLVRAWLGGLEAAPDPGGPPAA